MCEHQSNMLMCACVHECKMEENNEKKKKKEKGINTKYLTKINKEKSNL